MPIESINSLNNKLDAAGRDSTPKFEGLSSRLDSRGTSDCRGLCCCPALSWKRQKGFEYGTERHPSTRLGVNGSQHSDDHLESECENCHERANDVVVLCSMPDTGTDVDDHGNARQEICTVTGIF